MKENRIERWMHHHLDGTAHKSETDELRQALQENPALLRLLFQRAEEQADWMATLREDAAAEPGAATRPDRLAGSAPARPDRFRAGTRQGRGSRRWRTAIIQVAAGLLLAAGLFGYGHCSRKPALATVRDVGGEAALSRGRRVLAAQIGMPVRKGDRLTVAANGHIVMDWLAETTTMTARGETSLATGMAGDARRMDLAYGTLVGNVNRQPPDRPLVVTTPHARAKILGTRFTLQAGPNATLLDVETGRVLLTRISDGVSVEMTDGLFAVVADGIALKAERSRVPRRASIPLVKTDSLNKSLAGRWPLDNILFPGAPATDVSGANRHGLPVHMAADPKETPGEHDSWLVFDGANSYVALPGTVGLTGPADFPISLSAWFYRTGGGGILHIGYSASSGNSQGLSLRVGANGLLAGEYGDGGGTAPANRRTAVGSRTAPANEWVHAAFIVRGPQDMDIYLNGVRDEIAYSGTGGDIAYGPDSAIGRRNQFHRANDSDCFNGKLADVRVYRRALTPAEIARLAMTTLRDAESVTATPDPIKPNPHAYGKPEEFH